MEVWFGKYNGKSNSANKTYSMEWELRFGAPVNPDLEPYGEFNPYSPVFALSDFRNVNYCRYKYGDIYFYGYVEVSTHTNGMYLYKVTIDPLTTAYNAGCMNTDAFVEYGNFYVGSKPTVKSQFIKDPRLREDYPVQSRYTIGPKYESYSHVLLNIGNAVMGDKDSAFDAGAFTVPGSYSIIMDTTSYHDFAMWLCTENTKAAFQGADGEIFSMYAIPDKIFNNLKLMARSITSIPLVFGKDPNALESTGDLVITEIPVTGACYKIINPTVVDPSDLFIESAKITVSDDNKIDILNGNITIDIPFCGKISFSPCDLGLVGITNVGYSKHYDCINAVMKCSLWIDEVKYPEYSVMGCFGVKVDPFRWSNTGVNGSGSAILSSGVGLAFSAAMSAAPPGVTLASTIGQASQTVIGALKTGTSGSGSAPGTGSLLPVLERRQTVLTVTYSRQISRTSYQSLYGTPFFSVINLRNNAFSTQGYTGYVKTQNVNLLSSNLPRSIVEQAEAILNTGAYIGNVPQ